MLPELIENRDSVNDVGLNISMNLKIDEKSSVFELIISNFKRVQEALRTIEETLKLVDRYELSKNTRATDLIFIILKRSLLMW